MPGDPTPPEIAERAAAIRSGCTPGERRRRRYVGLRRVRWTAPRNDMRMAGIPTEPTAGDAA